MESKAGVLAVPVSAVQRGNLVLVRTGEAPEGEQPAEEGDAQPAEDTAESTEDTADSESTAE